MENQFFNENIDIKENICKFIDEWLKESKEYNNSSLASALGLSHSSIQRWRNRICAPEITLIPKLCKPTSQLTLTEANLLRTYQSNPDFKEFIDKYLSDEEFRSAINSIAKLSR